MFDVVGVRSIDPRLFSSPSLSSSMFLFSSLDRNRLESNQKVLAVHSPGAPGKPSKSTQKVLGQDDRLGCDYALVLEYIYIYREREREIQ